nr:Transglutaminase-like superfamily [Klebsiella pneumoniae]
MQDSAADAFARAKGCAGSYPCFLACCRALEIPARYVSGYVYSDNAQHVAMHAWRKSGSTAAGCRLISPIIPVA